MKGCSGLTNIIINDNQLENLNELSSTKLSLLYCKNNKLSDITSVKNCTNLTHVNFENNTDNKALTFSLIDISPLKYCSKIVKCYLEDNTNLDEVFLATQDFKTLLKRCGADYSLNKKYALVFTDGAKQDFLNFGLTDSQLRLLNGNESIRGIRLGGNPNLSDSVINEVLGSMPNLESVDLEGCTQVASIGFVNRYKKIKDLLLLNTGVTDLSLLEEWAKSCEKNPNSFPLGMLAINNSNIDITKIQTLISLVSQKGTKLNEYAVRNGAPNYGICIEGAALCGKFADCTEITCFASYVNVPNNTNYGVLDLSNCLNLGKVHIRRCGYTVKVPKNCTYLAADSWYAWLDVSLTKKIENAKFSYWQCTGGVDNLLSKLKQNSNLQELDLSHSDISGAVGKLGDLQTTKEISLSFSYTKITNFDISEDINYSISDFHLSNCSNFYTLDGFEHIKSMDELYIANDKVSSLKPLANMTSLNILSANNNKISSLEGVQNLVNLTTLKVGSNSISDLYWLGRLADNNQIKLTSLDLSDNSIENNITAFIDTDGDGNKESIYVDNLSIIEKLYNKGCKSINLKNNGNLDTSRLANLNGVQY